MLIVALSGAGTGTAMMNSRSAGKLVGVSPDLVSIVRRAGEIYAGEFLVIEGLRSMDRQRQLVKAGKSKTLQSRHLTGHAVDIVPIIGGRISWCVMDYMPLAAAMQSAARDLGKVVRWGGSWKRSDDPTFMRLSPTFVDAVHFEIPRS